MNNYVINKRKKMDLCSLLLGVSLLMFSCQDPLFESPNLNNPGQIGFFSLADNGLSYGRTIMPATVLEDFESYKLDFFAPGETEAEGDTPAESITLDKDSLYNTISLAVGTYDLYVTAYMDAAGTKPAAQGSRKGIEIIAGKVASGNVLLEPVIGNGEGTFRWEIEYPSDVVSAKMIITRLPETSGTQAVTLYFEYDDDNEPDPDPEMVIKNDFITLDSGYYRVEFNLSKRNIFTHRKVYRRETLHVYQNMESVFKDEFTEDLFEFSRVNIAAIKGVTIPVTGEEPVTGAIEPTEQYTGNVSRWYYYSYNDVLGEDELKDMEEGDTFKPSTNYIAHIILINEYGYTFKDVDADFFTVEGAISIDCLDSTRDDAREISVVFSKTAGTTTDPTVIDMAAIPGVTVPVTGATPVTVISETTQYTGTVSWSGGDATTFDAGVAYTATIALAAKEGFTLTGVAANFFTVAGATYTNNADSGIITAVFPLTAAETVVGEYGVYEPCADLDNLSSPVAYQVVNLTDEGLDNVMKVIKPVTSDGYEAALYDLADYKDQKITIEFSVDVKRVGAAGDFNWQINNDPGYPIVSRVKNAAAGTWYTMSGTWTGTPTAAYPSLYLSTYENNRESTTYYIDNFTIAIKVIPPAPNPVNGNMGNWDYPLAENGIDHNYRQAFWQLTEPNLTAAKTEGAKLVLVLSKAPTAGMQFVWQNPEALIWWQDDNNILDLTGSAISDKGVTWDEGAKTITIELEKALADYDDFVEQSSLNLVLAYYGSVNINGLGIVSADMYGETVVGESGAYEPCADLENLSSSVGYKIVNLTDGNRTNVMKVINPTLTGGDEAALYDLDAYKDQKITIEFSADVKRVGAAGDLNWQINNAGYPSLRRIPNAAENTWYTMSGTWTGTPTNATPLFYLSTYMNNSENTTYYIDNFTITVTPGAIPGNLGNWDYAHIDATQRNYQQAVWVLSGEKLDELKSAESLVLVLRTNPAGRIQLVWQDTATYGWHANEILNNTSVTQNGAVWNSGSKTLTIPLATGFKDYADIALQTAPVQVIVYYYGAADISALGIARAYLQQ